MRPQKTNKTTRCEAGHGKHKTLDIEINFFGEHHGLGDAPKIPRKWQRKLNFRVFDWKEYENTNGYCPADDNISRGIYSAGVWEGFNTPLFLDILDRGNRDNLVLDFGSNIGWYSRLATEFGYEVEAFDSDTDIAELFEFNKIGIYKSNVISRLNLGWIDENSKLPERIEDKNIEILKCDLEGSEEHVYHMCRILFEEQKINYVMMEISPVFNDSYFDLVPKIIYNGYVAYRIPQKGTEHFREFEAEPLETVKKYYRIETNNWKEYIKSFSQEDFLFIKESLI